MAKHKGRSWLIYPLNALLAMMLLLLILISAAGLGVLAYNLHYAGRIYEGVSIRGVDLGGLFPEEALALVRESLESEGLPYVLLFTGEQDWTFALRDMGGYLDLEEAVHQALALGRSGSFRDDMLMRFDLFWWGYDIVPEFHLEPGPAMIILRAVARQAGHPARRAQLWVAGLQALTDESQVGREMDITASRIAIEQGAQVAAASSSWGITPRLLPLLEQTLFAVDAAPAHGAPAPRVLADAGSIAVEPIPVRLVFRQIVPPLTEITGGKERAAAILSSPLTLTYDLPELAPDGSTMVFPHRWAVDRAVLTSWLTLQAVQTDEGTSLQVDVDREKIAAHLQKLADEISRAPREARFEYDPEAHSLITLTPGQNGYALDVETAQEMIAEACLSSQRVVSLPVRVVPPRVTATDLQAIQPFGLISEGESSFKGSRPGRLQNIHVASARFHGLVVPAGTTFSFLQHLGLVTAANGYSDSWIIYGDRTVRGPGGGVCQVSTTCFRAAFWGGYPIVERRPHAYRVSWYEPPIGLDAATFSPVTDMRFANDSDGPILVQTVVDEENARLVFRFYGKLLNRIVTMEGPVTSNPVKAGEPIYEEDPSLASGKRVQIEWPHDGIDVTLYRVIERDGQILSREKFFSRYAPWPARYRVGPTLPQSDNPQEG